MSEYPELIEKALEIFGVTNDCNQAGFILPDGKLLNMKSKHEGTRVDHSIIGKIYEEEATQVARQFVSDTGAIRLHHAPNTTFVEIDKRNKPTFEQIESIRICACRQGLEPHRIVYDIYEGEEIDSGQVDGGFRDLPCNTVVNKFINLVVSKFNENNHA
ncbi:MAG: hypothetical protein ACTSPB_20145 [Candidatus Thorarchaeota archaeon]